ncbi:MAG: precorrin-3B C(17)-methyltransferase [Prevotella sp.]
MRKIIVAGIGPGGADDMTAAVKEAIQTAEVIVGYKFYFQFIRHLLSPTTECIDTGMKRERERAERAFELAEAGRDVVVISSGDAGIYGMASLIYEMREEQQSDISITVLPGISAFQKAASLLGAPISHDFCVISLSDLMTPWALIERRIRAAATADFVTAIYNPRSNERYWQLGRLKEIFLKEGRSKDTPVGYVRQAGREGQTIKVTTLGELNPEDIDMLTIVIIGNSQTKEAKPPCFSLPPGGVGGGLMVTPRGYYTQPTPPTEGLGGHIMTQSFRTILSELKHPDIPLDKKWLLLHAIHTTADFDMENILYTDNGAATKIYERIKSGRLKTIVTDVTMVTSGIRKAALARLGLEVKCYLGQGSSTPTLTRTQVGIRLAAEENPDALFVFGNAPTALMELCDLMRHGKAHPQGIIAAPVGFVHVKESKHMVKSFIHVPKIIIEGRKGGSNIAATLCNAIMTLDDAEQLKPGRDL